MSEAPILAGARLRLTPFGRDRITDHYLRWLSDPVVNEFSRRRDLPAVTREEAANYLDSMRPDEAVLAIETRQYGHIGNVKYGPIDHVNRRSDIAIVIGEKKAWGQGYGAEAIYLLARWLFEVRRLNRVDAGSANPAFVSAVLRLGWTIEGVQRQRAFIGGRYLDWTLVAQLASEFTRHPNFERAGAEQDVEREIL